MKIAFLLTSYNRKDVTLRCLEQLEKQSIDLDANIYLTDDNSTDNTYEAVRSAFPNVRIFKSIGGLYWNRGMYLTWMEALKCNYDAYIWVNDDNLLYDDAVEHLIECAKETQNKSIICGCFCDESNNFTYGGARADFTKIIPNGELQPVHYMNGNFVLVPKNIVDSIGVLDPVYMHIKGDYDYGLTAIEKGIHIFSTKQYIGISPSNPVGKSRGRFKGRKCSERYYDSFHSPFLENPSISLYFNIKHKKGILKSLFLFIKALFVILLPDKIYYKLRRL